MKASKEILLSLLKLNLVVKKANKLTRTEKIVIIIILGSKGVLDKKDVKGAYRAIKINNDTVVTLNDLKTSFLIFDNECVI